ncbi:hypothetical protein [Synechococcus sp. KORDI-52]|uniref:hypothetical protein n=1 Tax=Synechococcus sp. KORDI-52 TaxID=585425 RepID=UPI001C1E069D|nr:hypothetical protein [Synechococcus sp. KORDI-52]
MAWLARGSVTLSALLSLVVNLTTPKDLVTAMDEPLLPEEESTPEINDQGRLTEAGYACLDHPAGDGSDNNTNAGESSIDEIAQDSPRRRMGVQSGERGDQAVLEAKRKRAPLTPSVTDAGLAVVLLDLRSVAHGIREPLAPTPLHSAFLLCLRGSLWRSTHRQNRLRQPKFSNNRFNICGCFMAPQQTLCLISQPYSRDQTSERRS